MPDGFRAEAPIRGELLSHDRLLDRMRELAREHLQARVGVTERPLLRRLNENARLLEQAYAGISAAARRQEPIPPAAEWLLDNFHLVEEQLADIRRHLPRGYYRKLPKLPEGALAGYPRVYAFALELISHTDGTLDEQTISACVQAYQEVAPLSIGELWAVAIMLRMGLVENLRRLAAPLEAGRRDRARADSRADLLISAATEGAAAVAIAVSELARESENLSGAYLVRLLQRLRGRGPELAPALDWVDRFLEERGLPPAEELTRTENQRQAADQVSLANTITSFRALSTLDWEGFFERCSVVEAELRPDPAGIYPLCDFATRDACRHAVEELMARWREAVRPSATRTGSTGPRISATS
jgi:cyclic beta-1,2-glucan synthetase